MNDLSPTDFQLGQNHPNPFSERTIIKFCVARRCHVRLSVCDPRGNVLVHLVDEERNPGTYEITFEPTNLSPGIYTCSMQAGAFNDTRKMLLVL